MSDLINLMKSGNDVCYLGWEAEMHGFCLFQNVSRGDQVLTDVVRPNIFSVIPIFAKP